jgi:hypothetical protein
LTTCLLVLLAAAPGCKKGGDMPATYPVGGEVLYRGGQPMKGGVVQLRLAGDTTCTVLGDIGEDGTFTLSTLKGKQRVPGAPEGDYEVSVLPSLTQEKMRVTPIPYKGSFHVGPGENHLRIELPSNFRPS